MRLIKGVLVVFEGIDGAGKTTQAKKLLEKLQERGYDASYFTEPSGSRWGRKIKRKALVANSLSPVDELELFLKDREDNIKRNVRPALDEKQIVILDRYYFSTMAYQGARGLDPLAIQKKNESFAIRPDLVFILDLNASQGLRRIEGRKRKDLLFEQKEYLDNVREIFRSIQEKNIIHIDASQSEEEIGREVEKIVFQYIQTLIIGDGKNPQV